MSPAVRDGTVAKFTVCFDMVITMSIMPGTAGTSHPTYV